jgi:hypothetical protein
MDGFTFGGTKAAQILAEEIDKIDDKGKTRQLVSNILDKYFKGLKDIQDIKNRKTYESIQFLWRDATLTKVDERADLSNTIKSFIKNVIKSKIQRQRSQGFHGSSLKNSSLNLKQIRKVESEGGILPRNKT